MSLLFFDGFESGHNGEKWVQAGGGYGGTLQFGTGYSRHAGQRGLRIDNSSDSLYLNVSTTGVTYTVGFAAYWDDTDLTGVGTNQVFWFRSTDGGNSYINLSLDSSGKMSIHTGSSYSNRTILLGTTSQTVVTAGAWHYIEFQGYIHPTAGVAKLRIDGTEHINFSGDTEYNSGTVDGSMTAMGFYYPDSSPPMWVDDFYMIDDQGSLNNSFLGDVKIEPLLPNGNGTTSNLTGSDGNSTDNYLLVDDGASLDTATYVESSTVGDKDTYAMDNISLGAGDNVIGVMSHAWAKKDDSNARGIKVVCVSGATTDVSSDYSLSSGFSSFLGLYETDPNTGSAWTEANVNAAEFGVQVGS